MNRNYNFRVDQYPIKEKKSEGEELYFGEGLNYKTEKSSYLDLYLTDNTRHCMPYNYLIYARLETEDNLQVIKLFQTTHMILIKGFRLDGLYQNIMDQKLKYVKQSLDTHIALADENEPFIKEIKIDWHGKN